MGCLIWHTPNKTRTRKSQPSPSGANCCHGTWTGHLNTVKRNHLVDILSPTSKKICLQNIRGERKYYKTIARKYWGKAKIELNEKENQELSLFVNEIEATGKGGEELENFFEKAEQCKSRSGKTLKGV